MSCRRNTSSHRRALPLLGVSLLASTVLAGIPSIAYAASMPEVASAPGSPSEGAVAAPTLDHAPTPITVAPFAYFSVSAAATGNNLNLELQQSDDGGSTWGPITGATSADGFVVNGSTSNRYNFDEGLPASVDGRLYRAVASNAGGTVTSTPARLTIATTTDLQITLTGPSAATAGAALTYTAIVTNRGLLTATDVTTAVAITGLSQTTVSPAASSTGALKVGAVTVNGTRWTTPSLAPGASIKLEISGTISTKPRQSVSVLAGTVANAPKDASLLNNVAAASTSVR